MRNSAMAAAVLAAAAAGGRAEVTTEAVEYTADGKTFKGLLAYDPAAQGKRPGVLVVHEWWGLNDYAKARAEQLAAMGYVAFAADMYGGGKTAAHPDDAKAMATEVRNNAAGWVGRAKAALQVLRDHPKVDAGRLAAVGYCFGGSTVQKLAFAGEDLDVAVSFHGAPVAPAPAEAKATKAKVLILHGADDPFIPKPAVDKLLTAMKDGGVRYEFEAYPGAVHSFTVKAAGSDAAKGMAYDADADAKSWAAMKRAFAEAFGK